MIQAIILLGGRGTRIKELFPDRPKALVPVAGEPFLARQLRWLNRLGIEAIHLAAGYLAQDIVAWLGQAKPDGQLSYSIEPSPLGTAGGLKFAQNHIRSDPFLVLNGDTLLPALELTALRTAAGQNGILAAIAVTQIRPADRYGTIEFDAQRRLVAFHEKAEREAAWINGGIYLMSKAILDLLPVDEALSLEKDIFPGLAAQRQLSVCPTPPPLLDMGTPAGLAAMEQYFR